MRVEYAAGVGQRQRPEDALREYLRLKERAPDAVQFRIVTRDDGSTVSYAGYPKGERTGAHTQRTPKRVTTTAQRAPNRDVLHADARKLYRKHGGSIHALVKDRDLRIRQFDLSAEPWRVTGAFGGSDGNRTIYGLMHRLDDGRFDIFVSKRCPTNEITSTTLHELGHLRAHQILGSRTAHGAEDLADTWASAWMESA